MGEPSVPLAPDFVDTFSIGQTETIRATFAGVALLGVAGSLFVIISFFLFPHLRTFNKQLILCLAIADLLTACSDVLSFGFFAHPLREHPLCQAQAIGIQFGETSSFLWSLMVCIYLYLSAVSNLSTDRAKKFLPAFLVVGFVVPIIPVIVVSVYDGFGNSTNGHDKTWCWIAGTFPKFRIGFYYGPMIGIWVINMVLSVLIIHRAFKSQSSAFKTVVVRLTLYILAALFANTPALINRIQNIADPAHPVFALFMLHATCNPLQGLYNAVVYSSSAPLREAYRRKFADLFSCCRASPTLITSNPNSNAPSDSEDPKPFPTVDEEEEAYENFRQSLGHRRSIEADDMERSPLLPHLVNNSIQASYSSHAHSSQPAYMSSDVNDYDDTSSYT